MGLLDFLKEQKIRQIRKAEREGVVWNGEYTRDQLEAYSRLHPFGNPAGVRYGFMKRANEEYKNSIDWRERSQQNPLPPLCWPFSQQEMGRLPQQNTRTQRQVRPAESVGLRNLAPPREIVVRPPTNENVKCSLTSLMGEIDEIKSMIPEGKYISMANRLKSMWDEKN